jgi:hypothetical protein
LSEKRFGSCLITADSAEVDSLFAKDAAEHSNDDNDNNVNDDDDDDDDDNDESVDGLIQETIMDNEALADCWPPLSCSSRQPKQKRGVQSSSSTTITSARLINVSEVNLKE